MGALLEFDQTITTFIYALPHTTYSDLFFQLISAVGNFIFIWIVMLIFIAIKEERKNRVFILFCGITLISAMFLTDFLLKPFFARPRPLSLSPNYLLLATDYPRDFSFPSFHATVALCAATLMSYFEKKWKVFFFIGAFLIAFSRVYLGFHYVGDVLAGAIIGWIVAAISLRLYARIFPTKS